VLSALVIRFYVQRLSVRIDGVLIPLKAKEGVALIINTFKIDSTVARLVCESAKHLFAFL
jgi:hypothetical protein